MWNYIISHLWNVMKESMKESTFTVCDRETYLKRQISKRVILNWGMKMSNINDTKFENGKQFSGRRGSTYKGRQDTAHARNWKGASVDRAPIMGEE